VYLHAKHFKSNFAATQLRYHVIDLKRFRIVSFFLLLHADIPIEIHALQSRKNLLCLIKKKNIKKTFNAENFRKIRCNKIYNFDYKLYRYKNKQNAYLTDAYTCIMIPNYLMK